MQARSDVHLRPARAEDMAARIALGRTPELAALAGEPGPNSTIITQDEAQAWFDRLVIYPNAWVIDVAGQMVGEARLDNLNPHDLRAHMGVSIYHLRYLGQGIGTAAVRALLEKAFGPLGLHRVALRVLPDNLRAIRCYERCGFRREGIERESARVGDGWADDLIMAILEHEFRAQSNSDAT